MLLEVPLVYEAEIVEARKRVPARLTLLTRIAVDFPVLTSAEAPLLALCRLEPTGLIGERRTATRSASIEYRRAPDGGLMKPVRQDHADDLPERPFSPPIDIDNAQENMDEWFVRAQGPDFLDWGLDPDNHFILGSGRAEKDVNVRTWINDDRDAREASLRRVLAGAAFVDGVLHAKSNGPGWRAGYHWRSAHCTNAPSTVGIQVYAMPEFGRVKSIFDGMRFRGDKREQALSYAQGCLDRYLANPVCLGNTEHSVREDILVDEIDVLEANGLAFDDDAMTLRECIELTFDAAASVLDKMPPAVLLEYATIRAGWEDAGRRIPMDSANRLSKVLAPWTRQVGMHLVGGLLPVDHWLRYRLPLVTNKPGLAWVGDDSAANDGDLTAGVLHAGPS